jgi:type I restriction enzyme, S subunit
MVNMGELFANRRIGDIEMERVPLHERNPTKDLLEPYDLLFARQSIVSEGAGQASIFVGRREPTTFESHLIRARIDQSKADPFWMFYFFESPQGRSRIRSIVNQVSVAGVRGSDLGQLLIPLPPLDEQRRIAHVLRMFDDKIDSNRRLASLLEETDAAVFRARFVDFVGVEEFEDSGIGRIPVGWKVGSLADIGLLHRQFVKGESELPYVGLDLMPRGSTVLTDWLSDDAPTGQAAMFDKDDILFGKLRPYFRKVGVAPISGRCSTEILVLRPREPDLYGVLLGHVASQAFIDHCSAVSRGTRMPRAEWKDAGAFRIAVPPTTAAREFSELTGVTYAQIRGLTMESRALREIRDAILPRLVAGEIRVPDTGDSEEVIGQGVTQLAGANP